LFLLLENANESDWNVIQNGRERLNHMNLLKYWHLSAIVLLLVGLAACNQAPNSQQIEQQTAQATAEVKHDAQAVAAGVREGWNRDKPLDLNTATKSELLSLPGVTSAGADRVIAGRPYSSAGDLVTRHIMAQSEYDKIADRVTAKR
jgi:DNA uptake protein ComE-like DNA-binding protein